MSQVQWHDDVQSIHLHFQILRQNLVLGSPTQEHSLMARIQNHLSCQVLFQHSAHSTHHISGKCQAEPEESLRSYIKRFETATSKVKGLRPATTVDSFIRNMNYDECKECCKVLCNKEPLDLIWSLRQSLRLHIHIWETLTRYYLNITNN